LELLRFRRFERTDLGWYIAWFDDPELARRVSAPDEDWLAYIDHPDGGARAEIASLDAEATPVAVLQYDLELDGGVSLLLMTAPHLRGKGLGTRILDAFAQRIAGERSHIDAYMEKDNAAGIKLARKCGFRLVAPSGADEFLLYRRDLTAAPAHRR